MIKKKLFILLLTVFIFSGCATAYKMNNLNLGMTKQEVINVLGIPLSTSAQNGIEYLNYRFTETDEDDWDSIYTPYYVRLIDGRVESYGKLGDFDSTTIPEMKSTVDLNVTQK